MKYLTVTFFSFLSIFLSSQPSYSFGSNFYSFKTVAANKTIKKIKIKLVVAVIKSDGSLLPVPRTNFEVNQYKISEIENKIIKDNKDRIDKLSDIVIKNCQFRLGIYTTHNDLTECISKDTKRAIELAIEPELNKALADMKKKYPVSLKIKTDLSGTATIEIQPGTWYISGEFSFSDGGKNSRINWDQKIEVKQGLENFELSNDNGNIFNY